MPENDISKMQIIGCRNRQNTNLHPQWNLVNSVSGSNVAGDTLQLTSSQNGWCVVNGFKYWDIAIIYVNNISLILEQNVGDSDAKTSFTHIFPVKKNDTVKITYPANPQKREFSIRLYSQCLPGGIINTIMRYTIDSVGCNVTNLYNHVAREIFIDCNHYCWACSWRC